ncbi:MULTISPECIES: COG4315 family predicted lipoprotein [Microbacterium]|uniref:COG4315 family predicted lipoprotein n=1 Tax=Microbacterium TaxID=33882 RepID=UPI00217ED568|nr:MULTISPECIES: hypothetical protein [Microbacterium]UWF78092.1 hypothetical protein JSY13_03375 [Microbacterium neungamense]WCM56270.1 hypothetical protein JRG78_03400 [Microbacterium sp. EF45047]
MRSKTTGVLLGAALVLTLGVAGCSSPSPGGGEEPADPGYGVSPSEEPSETPSAEASGEVALMTADSSLGEIVVDGEGMTVYMFDNDTQGTDSSACTVQCLENWPIVTVDSETPEVDGVTGEVGTIMSPEGEMQLTLNGWPLYYFAGDAAPGDVKGQGVNDVWWVLSPSGERMAE